VVDLEDAKARIRVAVSEGVEACTEKNILRDFLRNGSGKIIFGVAAAGDEEGTECHGKRPVGTGRSAMKLVGVSSAEHRNGDRVVEDERSRVVELVRGTTQSYAECSSGWAGVLHDERR
jgi:hypothetical protein